MPLPSDFLDLVEPDSRDFGFGGWQRAIGTTRLFRVVGLHDALDRAGLEVAQIFNDREITARAIASIPETWKKAFAIRTAGGWNGFRCHQLNDAAASRLQTFQKAVMSVAYVDAAIDLRAGGQPANPDRLRNVFVRPCIYFVNGLTLEFVSMTLLPNAELASDVCRASGQPNTGAFREMVNRGVSRRTAAATQRALHARGHGTINGVHRLARGPELGAYRDEEIVYNVADYEGAAAGAVRNPNS